MSVQEIRFVSGDYGGFASIYPALVLALNAKYYEVRACLTVTCAEKFCAGSLMLDPRIKAIEVYRDTSMVTDFVEDSNDLVVVSSSQSDEGAKAAALAMSYSSAPVLAVQDLYGSLHPTLSSLHKHYLDELRRICVSDEFSQQLMVDQFPDVADRIVVTGGPQFDKTMQVKEQWAQRRSELRKALEAKEDDLVFLVAGQLNGTAAILQMLEEALDATNMADRAKVIVRAHPRATDQEKQLLKEYYETTSRKWFCDVDRALASTSEDLLPAVNYLLSGYSTTNYFGILYGMAGVVYCKTPSLHADFVREKGLERPPEVDAGAGWYVVNSNDLERVIDLVQRQRQVVAPDQVVPEVWELQRAQHKIAQYNDGKAGERVWQEMQKLM